MKELSEYSEKELWRLYKNINLTCVTEFLREWMSQRNEEERPSCLQPHPSKYERVADIKPDLTEAELRNREEARKLESNMTYQHSQEYRDWLYTCFDNNFLKNFYKSKETDEQLSDLTRQKYNICAYAMTTIVRAIRWKALYKEDEEQWNFNQEHNIENVHQIDPYEILEELREGDEFREENDMALKEDVYDFIFDTLRFCTYSQICDILKWRKTKEDKEFLKPEEKPKKGRPVSNAKIGKYSKQGVLVTIYKNRQECLEKENISKGQLSNILSGKRQYQNGYTYKEISE